MNKLTENQIKEIERITNTRMQHSRYGYDFMDKDLANLMYFYYDINKDMFVGSLYTYGLRQLSKVIEEVE